MVAQNTAWTPSSSGSESQAATTPQPPQGVKWAPGEPSKKDPPPKAQKAPRDEPIEDKDPSEMTPAEKKIWKIKVKGKEREFDASNEEELRQLVEKAFGADEIFQESAKTRKQAETFFSMLQEAAKDPRKLAQLLKHEQLGGADFKKLAEQYLWEHLQEEKMTPEEKEQRRVKEELERYKQAEAEAKAKKEAEEHEKAVSDIQGDYVQNIKAVHAEIKLPNNPYSIKRMAEYAEQSVDEGREPNWKAIGAQVKADYREELKSMLASASPEELRELVSEDLLKKLRKMDVERLKTTTPDAFKATLKRGSGATKSEPVQRKLDGADWRAKLIRERG